jgi:hypothetical protein
MRVGKLHPLRRELVQVRRSDFARRIVRADVADSEIVRKDEDDVWLLGDGMGEGNEEAQQHAHHATKAHGQKGGKPNVNLPG